MNVKNVYIFRWRRARYRNYRFHLENTIQSAIQQLLFGTKRNGHFLSQHYFTSFITQKKKAIRSNVSRQLEIRFVDCLSNVGTLANLWNPRFKAEYEYNNCDFVCLTFEIFPVGLVPNVYVMLSQGDKWRFSSDV